MFLGLGKTALRVCVGYLCLLTVLVAIHFPYQVDRLTQAARLDPSSMDPGGYYKKAYAPVTVKEVKAVKEAKQAEPERTAEAESSYVKRARSGHESQEMVKHLTEFANQYGLANKKVLDVGAGIGYSQDIVADYTGLDISPTARRYFHKPFIEASATAMPLPDNSYDAVWSIWVLEHVPQPERSLEEVRRVTKDGGLIYMDPAWDCGWWASEGYEVRPFRDFGFSGKVKKASLPLLTSPYYIVAYLIPTRLVRQTAAKLLPGPTRLHYKALKPNYDTCWAEDSDAVNSIDYHEMVLWFTSRGDECLNCGNPLLEAKELIVRVHKQ